MPSAQSQSFSEKNHVSRDRMKAVEQFTKGGGNNVDDAPWYCRGPSRSSIRVVFPSAGHRKPRPLRFGDADAAEIHVFLRRRAAPLPVPPQRNRKPRVSGVFLLHAKDSRNPYHFSHSKTEMPYWRGMRGFSADFPSENFVEIRSKFSLGEKRKNGRNARHFRVFGRVFRF
jgi:hypothetical protein